MGGRNMMGRNICNIMSNRGMISDISNRMGQQMDSNMMDRDMAMSVMGRNMMGQDSTSQMMHRNMMHQQDMTPNMVYSNMMDMSNNQMLSKINNGPAMSSHLNDGLMSQRMMQKMEIARVPETY